MKTILLLILTSFFLFTINGISQNNCASALTLTPGTTQCGTNDNVGDFDDVTGDNPCDSWYSDGEYWFEYTANASGDALTLDVSALSATYSGIYVLDDCPSGSPNCIEFHSNSSSTVNYSITTPGLTPGVTYYIVIANWSAPYSTDFCLDATEIGVAAPTCSDGIQNQGEVGIDCGGPCPACTFIPISAGDQTLCSGTFTDAGGTGGQYLNDENYTATYCSDNGDDIIFTFNSFDTEGVDNLLIYDGPDATWPLLLDVNGHLVTTPFTVGSTNASHCLTFVWDSDFSVVYDGWEATISCGIMPTCTDGIQNQGETGIDCGGPCAPCPVSTCSGTFYDTGGAGGQYTNSEDYEVLYCSDNGDDIIFTFNMFDSEAIDHLYIYNGTDATAPLLLDVSGHAVATPFNVGSTNASDCLFFVWHSDGSIVYDGWEAFISCGVMPSCTDGIQNGGEQGIDCGGPCTPCVIPIDACGGTFYDTGGNGGDYSSSEGFIWTYCPDVAGMIIQMDFTMWDVEAANNDDQLQVFDGDDITAPLLYFADGLNSGIGMVQASQTNASGCLTFMWTSDSDALVGAGWQAAVSCTYPCQLIQAIWDGSTPVDNANYIDICQGDNITFNAHGSYPENNTSYFQSDAQSTFTWYFGDGTQQSGVNLTTVNHTYPNEGGYNVDLVITDQENCESTNAIDIRVRVSMTPIFAGTNTDDNTLCLGQCANLTGVVNPITFNMPTGQVLADTTFLPDGSGVTYTTTLTFTNFTPGQTVTQISDIIDICYELEHSYLGDLDIVIECPNGAQITLVDGDILTNGTSSGAYFGQPLGDDLHSNFDNTPLTDPSINLPGTPWWYCHDMSSAEIITETGTAFDVSIPAGSYLPEESFAGLIGCPLNGVWSIHITDDIGADNGWIYAWSINFDPSIYPPLWSFTNTYPIESWSGNGVGAGNPTTACPITLGNQDYVYSVTDDFGCTYDTTISILVTGVTVTTTSADPTCGLCNGTASVTSNTGGTAPYTYLWSNGATTQSITNLCAGTYDVTVTDDNGCEGYCSETISSPPAMILTLTPTDATCGVNNGEIDIIITNGSTPYDINWAPGGSANNQSSPYNISGLAPGNYGVTITDDDGCTISGTVNIADVGTVTAGFTYNGNQCLTGNSFDFTNTGSTGGAETYNWTFTGGTPGTSTLENPTGITWAAPGTYAVTQTIDAGSCNDFITINITVYPEPTGTFNITEPSCNGVCDGQAQTIPANGNAPYSYQWDAAAGGGTNITATGLCDGSYTVTITDANLCTGTAIATLTEPLPINLTATRTNVLCSGECTGTASVVVNSGGTGPFTYNWGAGSFPNNAANSGLCDGTYTVTVSDANGCTATASVTITEPANPLALIISGNDPLCNGDCNGNATVVASDGTPGYTYLWNDPAPAQTTATATGLCDGSYTVTVTDNNGCVETANITLTEPPLLTVNVTGSNITCNGACNGTVASNPAGGSPVYTYAWDNGAGTGSSANSLCANTYTVIVTDANGCTATDSYTVTQDPAVTANIGTSTNVTCFGDCNGTATVTPGGGDGSYTYLWNDPAPAQTTATASALCAGTFTVTVTDGAGCTATDNITITENPAVTANIGASTDVTCNGDCDGTATVTPGGGDGSYTYLWNDPAPSQTTATATGLCAGSFTVTVTDGAGCTATDNITITENPAVTASTVGADASCNGDCDGTATVTPGGGDGAYTYQWDDPLFQTTLTANGLCAGTYNIVVTDGAGCTATTSQLVDEPAPIVLTPANIDATCGNSDGQASVSVSGGIPAYTYDWSPNGFTGDGTDTYSNVPAGAYTIVVTDANLCTASIVINVNDAGSPTATITGNTNITCFGDCDGDATVNAVGGAGGYLYLWDDPLAQTTTTATGLCAGTFNVTVTDALGCIATASIILTENPALTASITGSTDITCFGDCDGDATVSVNGGTGIGTYTYLWDDLSTQTTAIATGLCAGTFTVIVTDGNGCTTSDNVTISENPAVTANIGASTDVTCFGDCDGTATVTAGGGNGVYTYLWDDPAPAQTTVTASNLCAGTFNVIVTDGAGCTATDNITITENPTVTANIGANTDVTCFGDCDGTATVTPGGGDGSYTYLWDDPATQTTATASALCAGTFIVVVTDGAGCTATDNITITENPAVTANIGTSTDVTCFGDCDGTATVTPGGGNGIYTYLWDNPATQTTAIATALCAGTFNVIVTDGAGCTATDNITITENPAVTANIGTSTDVTCFGDCDGTAIVTPGGGTGIGTYSFLWDDPAPQTTATATALCAGTFNVIVTDADGCTATDNITITENPAVTANIGASTDITCFGDCDGTATVTPGGGDGSYTYLWDDPAPAQTTITASALCSGTYNVIVTDGEGCTATDNITITENPAVTANIGASTDVTCFGDCDGTATVTPGGGDGSYTYLWDDPAPQTTATASALCAGTFNVIVTDGAGCTATDNITITENPAVTANIGASTDVICFGDCDGTATVTGAGGTGVGTYTYLWDDPAPQTTATATGLCTGTFNVIITDADGCTATDNITITENPAVTATINGFTDVSIAGLCDGDATVLAGGGTGAGTYTYLWDDPGAQSTTTATGLCAGTFTVTVTDANGCTATATITINEPNALIVVSSTINATCYGVCDGSAMVNVLGGVVPYTFIWDDPLTQTDSIATGLCAGSYNVTITDDNGAQNITNVSITEPTLVIADITDSTYVSCNGLCDGNATVTASGGTVLGAYSYLWDNPGAQTTPTASGLCAGTYTVTVTDDNGCTAIATIVITEPTLLLASITASNDALCNGVCDGDATVTATNGTPSYTYLWNDTYAQTSLMADSLCSGNYIVTVTDANGCTATAPVTIGEPTLLVAVTSVTDAHCGLPDGDATVTASGGTIGYTYLWDDPLAQTTQMADSLTTGLYSVTVTDANGCTVIATANVGDLSGVTATIIDQNNVSCNGVCDADATVQGNGGNPPYTYLWDDPGTQIDSMATGLCAGTFNVTVTDLNGCFSVASVVITEPIVLTASISSSNDVNCNSGNDGNASVTPSGGTSPYIYLWDGGATPLDSTNTGLIAGTFNVTVTDINGCTSTTSIVITEPTPIILTMNGNDENCLQANGWATVSATGGTVAADYTYLWDGGTNPATDSITNLSAGTYNVIVTDDNGCTATDFQIITDIPPGTAIISSFADVTCNGICDGAATVSIGGGVPPYTYLWDDPIAQTTITATGLCIGTYNVAVTDSNNCVVSTSVTISEPNALNINISVSNIVCFGDCNGSVTANVTGGTTTYNYQWDDPLLTIDSTAGNLCSGTYHVTVIDNNGCILTDSVTLADPTQMTISLDSIVSASCGQSDGSVYITINNGNAPFTYSWNAGTYTTEDIIGVLAGSYTVIVTDFRGCTATATYIVPDATGPTATIINIQHIDCFGNCNGTITVEGTGGTGIGTYTYKWDDPAIQTTQTATNLCAGTYNVTITDANGCISSANATITEPAQLNANYFTNNANCNSSCDGSAYVVVTGGTLPYTYQWNDPLLQTTDTASNLCAGQYDIFVTDSNNCIINNNISITEPTFISLSTTNIDVSCFGVSDGTATVDAIGGTVAGSYIYAWDDPSSQTTETALGLSDGTYCVTVTDDNGCTESICVTITTPTLLTAQITNFADVTCFGFNDGFAQVDVAGGTPGFTFSWSNTDTTQTITDIGGNSYSVIVTDANGCTEIANVVIDEPSQLLLTLNPTNETCYGYCDGYIDAIISGGTTPYNILWSDLQTTPTAINLCPNNYSVIITDDNGCTITANETITGPPLLEVINPVVIDANCGQANGSATVQINGGTAPTTYEWQDATLNTISNTLGITNVVAGAYSFTVTDFYGCQATLSVSISNLTGPNIDSIAVSNVDCYGNNNGTATVYASGGDFPYTYLWNPSNQVNQTAINLPGNVTYTINVTDNSGCIASQTVFVSEPQQLISAIVNNIPVSCYGGNDGSTTVQAAGGTNPLSYLWTPSGQLTPNATGLSAGNYIVNITDANGCTSMSNTIITEPSQMFVTETITDAICYGSCDGVISLSTSGGTQPPTFNWLAPASGINSFAANLCANNYTVIVSDANNCTQTLNYVVGEPNPIVITTSSTPVTCNTTNGSVSIDNITGGNGGYTYIWSPGNYTTATVSGLDDGTYTLQVEDSLGCSEIVYVDILNIPPPNQILFYTTDVLCNGGFDGSIETDVSGGNPPYTYIWSNGQTGVIASNLVAGQYNVTVTDTYGCTIDGFSTVYEPDILEVFLNGPTQTICIGQWANLTASANGGTGSGTYTFFWTDSTLVDSSAFQMVTPGETTTYQVYAVDSNGCMSNPVNLTVNVYPKIEVVVSSDAYICAGESTTISADASGGSGAPYTYIWSDGSTQQENDVHPFLTTTYYVSVYDNCTTPFDLANSTVYVTEAPHLTLSPVSLNGCEPLTAIFNSSATVNNGTVSYLWDFGDFSSGSNSSSDSITSHTYENPGTYDVTLTLTSNPANCVSVETFSGLIVVNEIPDAMFYSTPEVVSLFDANFEFWDQSTPVTQWQWIFGDGSTASTQNPEHQYTSADTFIVWLYVTTDAGCRDSVYNTVVVREENTFYAPTAFSPASGFQNNFFYPKGVGISKDDYYLIIYDRWGEIIYSTDVYPEGTDKKSEVSSGWNGRFNNTGDYVKIGTYTWYCKCKTIYGEEREETGAVTIIR